MSSFIPSDALFDEKVLRDVSFALLKEAMGKNNMSVLGYCIIETRGQCSGNLLNSLKTSSGLKAIRIVMPGMMFAMNSSQCVMFPSAFLLLRIGTCNMTCFMVRRSRTMQMARLRLSAIPIT